MAAFTRASIEARYAALEADRSPSSRLGGAPLIVWLASRTARPCSVTAIDRLRAVV
jgi:hypothetical protein